MLTFETVSNAHQYIATTWHSCSTAASTHHQHNHGTADQQESIGLVKATPAGNIFLLFPRALSLLLIYVYHLIMMVF